MVGIMGLLERGADTIAYLASDDVVPGMHARTLAKIAEIIACLDKVEKPHPDEDVGGILDIGLLLEAMVQEIGDLEDDE